jgi:hypothetical protein
MKLPSALQVVIFFFIITLFACNRRANEATSEDVPKQVVPQKAQKNYSKSTLEQHQNANAVHPSPIRNSSANDPDTVIHIQKTACYGDCPVFTATILSTGESFYRGKNNVEKIGDFTAKIDQRAIRKIDEKLMKIDFYDLKGRYPEDEKEIILDLPWVYVFSEFEDQEKHVAINNSGPKKLLNLISYVEMELDKLNWTPGEIKD